MPRVPAPEIEAMVLDALRIGSAAAIHGDGASIHSDAAGLDDRELVTARLDKAVVGKDRIDLTLVGGETVRIPWSPPSQIRKREIIAASASGPARPMKADTRDVLLRSIAQGRRWLGEIVRGTAVSLDAIAGREGCSKRHVERCIANAFLSPQIVKAAAEGRLPRGVTTRALADAPAEWSRQWQLLGLQPA